MSRIERPTVSVFVITYNHEKYIAQALDSILMQKTNFDFDIVIGEDGSTDNTTNIITEYEEKYPDKIKAKCHNPNISMMSNVIDTLRRCTGKYIAMLEGDDYWTDPLKLQKQVDLMELHPEVYICGHQTDFLHEFQGGYLEKRPAVFNGISFLSFEEVVMGGNVFHTSAFVFRNQAKKELLSYLGQFLCGDLPILLFYAQLGPTAIFSDCMSIYRRTGQGACSTPENPAGGMMMRVTYEKFLAMHPSYKKLFAPRISGAHLMLASSRLRYGGDLCGSLRSLGTAIRWDPSSLLRKWKTVGYLIARTPIFFLYKKRRNK